MFCPRCGEAMTLADSHAGPTYRCVRGDMQLSRAMNDKLSEVFIARSRQSVLRPGVRSGKWFCPGCGGLMPLVNGHLRCAPCDEQLDEFVHELIELHPHLTRLVLTVEDRVEVAGRGVVVSPSLQPSDAHANARAVELHRPDGSVLHAIALISVAFVDPPPSSTPAVMTLHHLAAADVPVGTRVWLRS